MMIKKAALIGLGAIGSVYGKLLQKKYDTDFAVIANGARGDKLRQQGATVNGETYFPHIFTPTASDYKVDLLIFCVKNYQLDDAIAAVAPLVDAHTLILPLLNGVTARERILAAYPNNTVFYGIAMGIDGVRTAQGVVHTSNGTIQFGHKTNTPPTDDVMAVEAYLNGAGLATKVFPDMERMAWKKWMLNVGCNQVSALTGAPYGPLSIIAENVSLMHDAMLEVVALAEAKGIDLTIDDLTSVENVMKRFAPQGKTSMLQDVEAKRPSEVDYFSGTVITMGQALQVPTPTNSVFYRLIKAREQLY